MSRAVFCLLTGALFLGISPVYGQDLSIGLEDLRIEQRVDGGFHLFIRKKPDISSVLLTESTRDPALVEDNFAYRSPVWNPINGDEIRVLNGRPISREQQLWSLIDSSPESHPELGAAFHIYIPYILNFGSENSRHGEVYVVNGTYFNIRAFSLPYADYRGRFKDNPYVLEVTQKPLEGPPEGNYMQDTVEAFTEIAAGGHGELVWSTGPADLVDKIASVLDKEPGRSLDLVLCLDTTSSMQDDIEPVRKLLIPMLEQRVSTYANFRIGMVLYKDYFEEYLHRLVPFTQDFAAFQRSLNAISVSGGRDIPEAVYEALYEGAVNFPWEGDARVLILIGDAPPHARARGKITKTMVDEAVTARGIRIHPIILPQ
ncbi:MAG: VWA domain-containing protein [Spirochaetaceae bacterium]|nr:VWA domain-containing protein [Spirochaetaceae bacterium]